MKTWFHFFFKKRLSISLFLMLPFVLALTAFSSGFIALIFIDYFLVQNNGSMPPAYVAQVNELMFYIRHEILLFTFLGGGAGFAIAYAIHRSLGQLSVKARQLSQGDFNAQLKIENLGELGFLGKDFNRMVSSLNKYFIDTMTAGWFLLDKSGTIVSIDPGAQAILMCQGEDLIGKPLETFSKHISQYENFSEPILDTIKHQKNNVHEVLLAASDGRSTKVSLSTAVLKSPEGIFIGIAVTLKDLTRAGEIAEHMQRTDKLSALGTMAAGLAHEIRNPLGAIKGLAQLLHEKMEGSDHAYTQTMIKEVDRLNGIVSNLLNFSQPTTGESQLCDVNQLLNQAMDLLQLDIESKKVKLVKNLSPALPKIWADGKKILQAFLNILINAAQAANTGDSNAMVRIESRFDPEGFISDKEKECIIVEIANNGASIDPRLGDRIFDPFVTTKKEGSGLGLPITHQIVSMHRGVVSFGSRGGFTVFTIKLPPAKNENPVETVKKAHDARQTPHS